MKRLIASAAVGGLLLGGGIAVPLASADPPAQSNVGGKSGEVGKSEVAHANNKVSTKQCFFVPPEFPTTVVCIP